MSRKTLFVTALAVLSAGVAAAQPAACVSSDTHRAAQLAGEVSGKHMFLQPITDDLRVQLVPAPFGWDLRLLDSSGSDLSRVTPPFRGAPNPRELYGWHFRNAANTGANQGDVNAPQQRRSFLFSRTPGQVPAGAHPSPESRGRLEVLDMGLAGLEPGAQARLNYLKFRVCVEWPVDAPPAPSGEAGAGDRTGADTTRETFAACGLPLDTYELGTWLSPTVLTADLDGDDVLDSVALITRRGDSRRGLAVCRAGTSLALVGFGAGATTPLKTAAGEPRTETYLSLAQFFQRAEAWEVRRADRGFDEVVLSRTEKAELAIRWGDDTFEHELLWVFVEP